MSTVLGHETRVCEIDVDFSRRLAWNCTLLVGGIFGLVAGAAPNFTVFCVFIALLGFGVGGNLPVDGTMFIEFLPGAKQWLLTLLSAWWAIGQVVGTLVGVSLTWAFGLSNNVFPLVGKH